jgi:hypothetical protein
VSDEAPEYVVVAQIPVEELSREIKEAMIEAARLGIGEAILIVERHREISVAPEMFDATLDDLRQHSASFSFEAGA